MEKSVIRPDLNCLLSGLFSRRDDRDEKVGEQGEEVMYS